LVRQHIGKRTPRVAVLLVLLSVGVRRVARMLAPLLLLRAL